jgi:uncharacterized protein
MTWEYGIIGLVIGLIVGALLMRFGSSKLRDQHAVQYELEKTHAKLQDHKQEVSNHFAKSAELLNEMTNSYRELYQHMAQSSQHLLPEELAVQDAFQHRLTENSANKDTESVQMPRDYSENASGLLRSNSYKA